jgi:hypothetical protein
MSSDFEVWVETLTLNGINCMQHVPATSDIYVSNLGASDIDVSVNIVNADTQYSVLSFGAVPSNKAICISQDYVYTASFNNTDISNGAITRSLKVSPYTILTYGNPPVDINPQAIVYDISTNNLIMADYNSTFLIKIILPSDANPSDISYTPFNNGLNGVPTSLAIDLDSRVIYALTNGGIINRINIDDDATGIYKDLGDPSLLNVNSWSETVFTQGLWFKAGLLYFGFNNNGVYKIYRLLDDFTVFQGVELNCSSSIYAIVVDDIYNIFYSDTGSYVYKSIESDPPCFNKGTKILCLNQTPIPIPPPIAPIQQRCLPRNQLLSPAQRTLVQPPPQVKIEPRKMDEYIPIELLKVGDFVKTYKHGYRKISKIITGSFRNNPKKWNMCMYKMVKTESNGLLEDLIVTGGHAILVDSISEFEQAKYDAMGLTEFSKETIDNKRLLLSSVSTQFNAMQDNKVYTYYHLLLENNDDDEERFGIWANGILTETPNVKYMSK